MQRNAMCRILLRKGKISLGLQWSLQWASHISSEMPVLVSKGEGEVALSAIVETMIP